MDYKEAFFRIADDILTYAKRNDWQELLDSLFSVLKLLDVPEGDVIKFVAAKIIAKTDKNRALDFLKKEILTSIKPAEELEEPEISEIGHGDEGTT